MKYINLFKTTEEFNQVIGGGGELSQLEHYVALTKDNNLVHLKPLPNILIINTNNTGTRIYKRTDNQNGNEIITLENGENKLNDWNYGFYFYILMKQEQITSFDFSKFDTSNVSNMSNMFHDCSGLTSLDVSNFDTSNVTDMSGMFHGCSGLTSLDLSNFDTSNVSNMSNMFHDCSGLTSLDLSNFNISKVTDMAWMFHGCSGLTSLDLSNFNTSNVSNMSDMFRNCPNLTSLDLSNFNISKVTDMAWMFKDSNALTHIKCKQEFKEWCWNKENIIGLPEAMCYGGSGTWDIVE